MEWSTTSASFVQKKVLVVTRIQSLVANERSTRKQSLGVDVKLCLFGLRRHCDNKRPQIESIIKSHCCLCEVQTKINLQC